ncbi:6-phosphofructokinase [Pseudoalteromonas sp. PS5]|uniref:6-phosphofructokinase n=1 Tax=Pseudoalteromonas sp. PS5 TaxID=1437473 RepID=UPI000FFF10AC|nr:6-phosphofructokinase [Pseudoalteromonas sp. PS5]RXF01573.1 ATP-dependent 6-phosphofructokinase [Pseudoalteromonas sp. PS5]
MTKRIAILTSGGDAPGMNSAIRAITLTSAKLGLQCVGFLHGYNGLINQEYIELTPDCVIDITQRGGTLLKSARCDAMLEDTGVQQAANALRKLHIDALIVIGGDGSFRGIHALSTHWHGQLIGLPGTIDNDLAGCDHTIGFSSAVNTATVAIDKIRDTANAFERVFITEVMGRHSGHIAYNVGIATGAEAILSFENYTKSDTAKLVQQLQRAITEQQHKHGSFLIILAENLWPGGAHALRDALNEQSNINCALCVLGHIQRGGAPSAEDRMLATELGVAAVETVYQAIQHDTFRAATFMLGNINGVLTSTPISTVLTRQKPVPDSWVKRYRDFLAEAES